MPSRFEHRATFAAQAGDVFSTLVDEMFLTARLRDLGGKSAALLDHHSTGESAAFRLRQGVDGSKLPSVVRSIVNGDLVVEREERWRGYESAGRATINGVPADITSRGRLTERGGGTELVISAEVKVAIPLVGGKIEKVVAEQVTKLLAAEAEYAEKWLAERA
ncbi:DUF2505 domain-containing protein [Actinophytocola glycyrrhizae]|uniref:DUF2505 domain-containing protein n=1 Tax=Actinophytocola glycyrrhizae TaxID=2044873 RepID=A0ABV9RXT3_9PSEU